MGKGIRLLIITLALFSCSADEDIMLIQEPTLELDGRLPMDSNGYYLLELSDSSHQTIHTISGSYIPEGSGSYSIIDMATNEEVIPFGAYTTMSCDSVSPYFMQDLNGFEQIL